MVGADRDLCPEVGCLLFIPRVRSLTSTGPLDIFDNVLMDGREKSNGVPPEDGASVGSFTSKMSIG